jgi:crotonobetainyl-CoA:carnitine CoA-transferase CaiB-like acyl-CoA transferase
MARATIEGRDPPSFADPIADRPWPVYDVFDTAEANSQVFVGVVTDPQWRSFCSAFGLIDLTEDPTLDSQQSRILGRPWILERVRPVLRAFSKADVMARLELGNIAERLPDHSGCRMKKLTLW